MMRIVPCVPDHSPEADGDEGEAIDFTHGSRSHLLSEPPAELSVASTDRRGHEVEAVVDDRVGKAGEVEYMVHWLFRARQPCWLPAAVLLAAPVSAGIVFQYEDDKEFDRSVRDKTAAEIERRDTLHQEKAAANVNDALAAIAAKLPEPEEHAVHSVKTQGRRLKWSPSQSEGGGSGSGSAFREVMSAWMHRPLSAAGKTLGPLLQSKIDRDELWLKCDQNNSGSLSVGECKDAFAKIFPDMEGVNASAHSRSGPRIMIRAFNAVDRRGQTTDKTGNGLVERDEFRILLEFIVLYAELHALFLELDRDGDHKLTAGEFRSGFLELADTHEVELSLTELSDEYRRLDTRKPGFEAGPGFDAWCVWLVKRKHVALPATRKRPATANIVKAQGLELVISCSDLPTHGDHNLDTRVIVREVKISRVARTAADSFGNDRVYRDNTREVEGLVSMLGATDIVKHCGSPAYMSFIEASLRDQDNSFEQQQLAFSVVQVGSCSFLSL